jgi:hypothetical protein
LVSKLSSFFDRIGIVTIHDVKIRSGNSCLCPNL